MIKGVCLTLALLVCMASRSDAFWWNGNWAMDCDFYGSDLSSVKIRGEDCSTACWNTAGCTHYTWTDWEGGTCFMKTGKVCKEMAVWLQGAVCGVLVDKPCVNEPNLVPGELVWSDEFDYKGSPSAADWVQETGGHGWGNNELQYYTTKNADVRNGNLVITSKKERVRRQSNKYTSSRLISAKKFKYGVFEMRAKLPAGRGVWSAFWMLSATRPLNWPRDGEIDIMENVGYDPNTVHATVHTEKFNHMIGTQVGASSQVSTPHSEFHTYSIDWTPSYIKAYIDGVHYFTYDKSDTSFGAWPFDTDFNIILNVAVGGNWGGVQGVDDAIFPTTYTVEYVRQYQNGFVQV